MIYEYNPDALRIAYHTYLKEKYPRLKPKSVKTKVDDVFAVMGWLTYKEFWDLVTSDEAQIRSKRDFLADEFLTQRANPKKDAQGYIRALLEFYKFIRIVELIEMSIVHKPRRIKPSNL